MSHQSTPHLTNKRTPGRLASDTPGQMNSTTFSEATRPVLNSSRSVCDVLAASAKQLLNAYIYEFLIKNTLPQTAKCFVSEADVPSVPYDLSHLLTRTSPLLVGGDKDVAGTPQTPALTVNQLLEDHNIPNLAVSMESPQGFLYEWWHVFWDIFQASSDRRASNMATQYHQMQSIKQKQYELQNMESGQNMAHLAAMTQTQQHVQIPPHLQGPMPIIANPGPIPMQQFPRPPQLQLQQQPQQMQQLDGRQRYMMQMMMKQQQQQQQQQQQAQQVQQQQAQQSQPQNVQQGQQGQPLQQAHNVHQAQQNQQQQLQQQHLQQQQPGQPANPQQSGQQLNSQPGLQQPLHQGQQQQQQQRPMLYQQQSQQAIMQQQGGDQPINSMAVNGSIPLQPMFVQQQQQQQQQQHQHHLQLQQQQQQQDQQNRIQQQAQSQMNNLRQQAVAALQQQQPMHGMSPASGMMPNASIAPRDGENQPMAAQRMNSARGRMMLQQGVQLQFPQQNMGEGTLFAQQPVGQNLVNVPSSANNTPNNAGGTPNTMNNGASGNGNNIGNNNGNGNNNINLATNNSHHPNGHIQSQNPNNANNHINGANGSNNVNGHSSNLNNLNNANMPVKPPNGTAAMNGAAAAAVAAAAAAAGNGNANMGMPPMATSMLPSNSNNALQDYQMQLMLLEKQNKKRLDIARLNGATDAAAGGQIMQLSSSQAQLKNSPIPSPGLNNKPSPNPSTLPNTKKGVKRGRKASVSSTAASPLTVAPIEGSNASTNGRSSGNAAKKEYVTPLTPAAESDAGKKKQKNASELGTKKGGKAAKKEKATPKIKKSAVPKTEPESVEVSEKKTEQNDSSKMPPPGTAFYQTMSNEKMMNVDILSSGNNSEGGFFPGGSSTIDDVDFDFNSFLDGGDVGLNDGLTGFNWGNPIEGSD